MFEAMLKEARLLIVEDEELTLDQLCEALEKDVKSIKRCLNGKEAWDFYQEHFDEIDIVLTDIRMPVMNGVELIEHIKKHSPNQEVIVLSANSDSETLIDIINLGVNSFILKPVLGKKLISHVLETYKRCYKGTLLTKYMNELIQTKEALEKQNEEQSRLIRVLEQKIKYYPPTKAVVEKQKAEAEELAQKDVDEDADRNYYECILEDHKHEMIELEEQIDATASLMILSRKIDLQKLYQISSYFTEYGLMLSYYHRFSLLGGEIASISEAIDQFDPDSNPDKGVILDFLESFLFTLKKWRVDFFEGKLKTPNDYDNSMLSDIQTIKSALKNEYTDGEMEFF